MYPAPVWLTGSLLVYDMPTLSGSQEVPTPRLPLGLDNTSPLPPKRPYINLVRTVERHQSQTQSETRHRQSQLSSPARYNSTTRLSGKHFAFC